VTDRANLRASDADRDFIMDAAQGKEYGIVDHVISRRER